MYRYGIEENMNNFNKIAEHINGKQIDLYKVIFSILENCIIIKMQTVWKSKSVVKSTDIY